MPTYEVQIGEVRATPAGPIRPGEPTPEVRSVFWRGEAVNEGAAKEAGYGAWEQKYGRGRAPVEALIAVTEM
jgi:hypothetical protein